MAIRVWDVTGAFIRVWDATAALLRTIPAQHRKLLNQKLVSSINFSPSASSMLAVAGEQEICLWDIDSGSKIRSINGHGLAVFSPDGSTIATTCNVAHHVVNLVDIKFGKLRGRMGVNLVPVLAASFSRKDSGKVVTCSGDSTCRVWDTSNAALLQTIEFEGEVHSVSCGRDFVRDTQCVAFAMGQHPRLGQGSRVVSLEVGVVRMILDLV